jgi:hypothetical protein
MGCFIQTGQSFPTCFDIAFDARTASFKGSTYRGNMAAEWKGARLEDCAEVRRGEERSTGYGGLVNMKDGLINICYQNSMLQALFASHEFRRGILALDIPSPAQLKAGGKEGEEGKEGREEKEGKMGLGGGEITEEVEQALSLLRYFQDVFARLSLSQDVVQATHDLQKALPEHTFASGRQQDTYDFYQFLFAQLEAGLKYLEASSDSGTDSANANSNGACNEHLLDALFKFTVTDIYECKDCGSRRVRPQECTDLPLAFPTRLTAISDVRIVSGTNSDLEIPEGFVRVSSDLNKGRDRAPYVFLCVKRLPSLQEAGDSAGSGGVGGGGAAGFGTAMDVDVGEQKEQKEPFGTTRAADSTSREEGSSKEGDLKVVVQKEEAKAGGDPSGPGRPGGLGLDLAPISEICILAKKPGDDKPTMPEPWERIDANLNQGGKSDAQQVYLFVNRASGSPITDISVVYGDDEPPVGSRLVRADLNAGSCSEQIWLCTRQDLPLKNVLVAAQGQKGWTGSTELGNAAGLYLCVTDSNHPDNPTFDQGVYAGVPTLCNYLSTTRSVLTRPICTPRNEHKLCTHCIA